MTFDIVRRALDEIARGRMVILVDDEDRENEGDLCMAADKVTPEAINFMAKYGRGLICLTLTEDKLQKLNIPMMVQENTSTFETAFTVSIEARRGVTTGISAADRATTIAAAIAPDAKPDDLVRPGHIFPLRAQSGGVLVRTGQTEGAVDLARLAGLQPAGVICEIMNDDGSMARMPDLEAFSREHGILILTIADLIEYRLAHESLVHPLASRKLEHSRFGSIDVHAYGTTVNGRQHLVISKGIHPGGHSDTVPLVRVQAGQVPGDVFAHLWNNDRTPLDRALSQMEHESSFVLIYLDGGAVTAPLAQRIAMFQTDVALDDATSGSNPAVLRELGIGAQILRHLGLSSIRILSNHPKRLKGLASYGLRVEQIVPLSLAEPTLEKEIK